MRFHDTNITRILMLLGTLLHVVSASYHNTLSMTTNISVGDPLLLGNKGVKYQL